VLSLETGITLFSSSPNATAFLDVLGFFLVNAAANCLLELAAVLTATRFIAATGGWEGLMGKVAALPDVISEILDADSKEYPSCLFIWPVA